ncbi:MAG: hypothetical protein ABEH38_01625 [Flavobacteriales bacterium]
MRVMKFRTLLDTEDDVFRDIEIPEDSTLQDLHEQVQKAFGLSGQEMSSFYRSDDQWNKGEEFPLIDMGDEEEAQKTMDQIPLHELVGEEEELKLIYVYNFLNMWIFCLDFVKRFEPEPDRDYPRVAMSIGEPPQESADDIDPLKGLDLGEGNNGEDNSNGRDEGDVGSDVDDLFKDL